jgi:hypothetical protein
MTTSPLVKGAKPIAAKDLNIKKRNPTIEDFNFPDGLPTADELPDSDDTSVDSAPFIESSSAFITQVPLNKFTN